MSTHTPGPWDFRGSLGPTSNPHLKGPHVVEAANGSQIAILNGWRSDVSEANARLIAAAPELLDALTRMLKQFPADSDLYAAGWDSSAINEACDAYDAARAAIRKATGEE